MVNGLVAEHGGTWGVHRSRSFLGPASVSGKVVYFTLPVPRGRPGAAWTLPRRECRQAARDLERLLTARGLGPLHRSEGWNMAVLSVRAEITAWVRNECLSVTLPPSGTVRYPTWEMTEGVEAIIRCHEDLDARGLRGG